MKSIVIDKGKKSKVHFPDYVILIEGYPAIIGERISIRIAGVDTPEMKDKRKFMRTKARAAKRFTVEKLRAAKKIELRNVRRGKYFRIVANVMVDGEDLGKELVRHRIGRNFKD
ncbi:thermonuclease family protein [Candidatus Margulisiibacteriota bacterium]